MLFRSAEPSWADYVMGAVEAEQRVMALDGIGCQPVLISATTEEMLEWIGDGLRSQAVAFPEKNGPIAWPKCSRTASLSQFPAALARCFGSKPPPISLLDSRNSKNQDLVHDT